MARFVDRAIASYGEESPAMAQAKASIKCESSPVMAKTNRQLWRKIASNGASKNKFKYESSPVMAKITAVGMHERG